MGTDIADATARPRLCRIGAPGGLLLSCLLDRIGEPVLHIFRLHQADVAEFAIGDHRPSLADHRVSRVVVGHGENAVGALCGIDQFPGLFACHGQRLVADDMDARVEEFLCDRVVQVIRCYDGDDIDSVVPGRLGRSHVGEICIRALVVNAELASRGRCALWVGRERPGDEFVFIIDPRRNAMHIADKCALPAADHAEPNATARPPISHSPLPPRPSSARLVSASISASAKSSNARSVTRIM